MIRGIARLLPAFVVVLGACAAQAPPPPAVDVAAEEQAVRAVSARWLELEKGKDAAGVAALFATDGAIYREDLEPVMGPAGIQAHLEKSFRENPSEVTDWTTDRVDVAASGDLATEQGTWSVRNSGASGTDEDHGKYLTSFRKINGEWKVIADMALSTAPAPAAKPTL